MADKRFEPPQDGFPAFNPRRASPVMLQKLMEEGIEHHKAGRKEEAERCYRNVLEHAPNQPDALNLLGVLAADEGLLHMAVELMERAIHTRPRDPHILNNLGHALWELRRFEEAREHLERAVALKPDFDEAKYNLGRVLRHVGEVDQALQLWREVWAKDDRVYAALVGITGILSDQGKFEEAERAARQVIERLPHRPAGYVSLAHVHKFRADDGTLDEIENQLKDDSFETRDKISLHYAAGKICDDLALYSRAFHHFDTANKLAYKDYDHTENQNYRRLKKQVFSKKFFRERQGWGFKSDVPVFIVGMPRSGTTLTEQILSAHPQVYGAGEIESFERMAKLSELVSPSRDIFPLSVLKVTPFGANLIGRRYVRDLVNRAGGSFRRITNKMPHNFELLGLIALALPNAKIIHCRRDPVDTCLSCWTKNFNDAHGYNRSLNDIGKYYQEYHSLMEHWRQNLPIRILDVDYESYTTDLEGSARRIVEFVELDWDPKCLEFYSVDRAVRTASQWQVRQPIYQTSVQKWRKYMPELQPLLDALGSVVPAEH